MEMTESDRKWWKVIASDGGVRAQVRALSGAGQWREAIGRLGAMLAEDLKPSPISFTTVMAACASAKAPPDESLQ
eukprot:2527543-Pyramimonas_sp.AAC.1